MAHRRRSEGRFTPAAFFHGLEALAVSFPGWMLTWVIAEWRTRRREAPSKEPAPVDLYLSLRAGGHHHYCDAVSTTSTEDVRANYGRD